MGVLFAKSSFWAVPWRAVSAPVMQEQLRTDGCGVAKQYYLQLLGRVVPFTPKFPIEGPAAEWMGIVNMAAVQAHFATTTLAGIVLPHRTL